jgi:hypothetical protein
MQSKNFSYRHFIALLAVITLMAAAGAAYAAAKASLPLVIYNNGSGNSGFVPSGWMGNTGKIQYNGKCHVKPPKGTRCLKISFTGSSGWGGIVWQNPANNWGDTQGGINITGAKKLVFWAKAKHGGVVVTFGYGLIGKGKAYHDSSSASKKVTLGKHWKKYSISLKGKNMSRIITGFYWSAAANGSPFTFYLDDVKYQK